MTNSESDIYTKNLLLRTFISHENYRKYNVPLAKALNGIERAVLLNDLMDQYFYLLDNNKLVSHVDHGDDLMFYTIQQAYDRCGINKDSFDSALKMFISLGFISKICKFGIPCKKYIKLDLTRIYDWIFSSNLYSLRKPANSLPEIREQSSGNPQRNDNYNESNNESKYRSTKSPSQKNKEIVKEVDSFDPLTYVLRDGQPLKRITAGSYRNKMKDPNLRAKILSNVRWYENQIDSGVAPKKSHEAFLQFAITNDMASKGNSLANNDLYARMMKEEHKLDGMKIMKTVVQLYHKGGTLWESINKNLPEETFGKIIDEYVKKHKEI